MTDYEEEKKRLNSIVGESQNAMPKVKHGGSTNHPMGIILWTLGSLNFFAGIILSVNSRSFFGVCQYSHISCSSASQYEATPLSEIMSFSWAFGLSGLLVLGGFAVIINLLNTIAINTSRSD
jgi:hypothetical protein